MRLLTNYLAVMQINCQYTTPGKWKYGEPHFEVRHPVGNVLIADHVPCGGQVRDLTINVRYKVFGFEGTVDWFSSDFIPGHVVIIQMP